MPNFSAIHMALQNSDDLNRAETSKLCETLANLTGNHQEGHFGPGVMEGQIDRNR
jgi:hypothetical protein